MRDELLNGEEFDSLLEARVVIGAWVEQYNNQRLRGFKMRFMPQLGGIRGLGHRVDHDARSRHRSVERHRRPIRSKASPRCGRSRL